MLEATRRENRVVDEHRTFNLRRHGPLCGRDWAETDMKCLEFGAPGQPACGGACSGAGAVQAA
jgi:hypothetical protein